MRLRDRGGEQTSVFFATDIHGSEKCFMKFVNSAKHYNARVLILGGDVCGKVMVPIVHTGNGHHEAQLMGEPVTVDGTEELDALVKSIRMGGYYPYVTTPDELEALAEDTDMRDRVFNALIGQTLARWVAIAEDRLAGAGVSMYMMLGNDDDPEMARYLEGSSVVQHAEDKVLEMAGGLSLLSFGYSNRTPWNSPRELDEDALYERVERLAMQVEEPDRCVFNLHCPPIASGLDDAPMIDEDLRPVATLAAGGVATKGVGSTATRRAIEAFSPLVGLHGHVHESGGTCRIGRTTCFNPGSEYGTGILRGVLLAFDSKRGLRNFMFTTG
jgi:uncharacterized protein